MIRTDMETGFRVRVSLERFFSDERAHVLVWCSHGEAAGALASRLRAYFRLPPSLALLAGGHLLPPREPLAVLGPDDLLEVIPVKFEMEYPPLGRIADNTETDDRKHGEGSVEAAVAPAESCPSPVRSGAAADTPDAPGDLEAMKRHALDLLDEYSTSAPKRRRRRGRGRRGGAPQPAEQADSEPEPEPATPAGAAEAVSRDAAVLRNGATSPRPARLVRGLSVGCSLTFAGPSVDASVVDAVSVKS